MPPNLFGGGCYIFGKKEGKPFSSFPVRFLLLFVFGSGVTEEITDGAEEIAQPFKNGVDDPLGCLGIDDIFDIPTQVIQLLVDLIPADV
jgi:hypothetical protein